MKRILYIATLFFLASCGGNGPEQGDNASTPTDSVTTTQAEPETEVPAQPTGGTGTAADYKFPNIEGKVWQLASYTLDNDARTVQDSSEATLTIEGDKAYGSGGCNRFSGSVQLQSDGMIKFGQLAATKMLCRNIMSQEQAYLQLLQNARSYSVNKIFLEIESQGGSLSFRSVIE